MSSVMGVRGFTTSLVIVVVALAVAGAAPATSPIPGESAAFDAVKHAAAAHELNAATAAADRAEIERAVHLVRTLPAGRWQHVDTALEQVGAFNGRLTTPSALVLFGQLKANDDYFSTHWAPANHADIVGDDGVVYRYFTGGCFEFHPLANFGQLNAFVAAKNASGAAELASALVARGVHPKGGGVAYDYYFGAEGGRPPWTSGMAQAVAAQAFAGAAALLPSESSALLADARAAYQLIPGHLLTQVAAGPWIRLYGFSSLPILNAQLQTVVSLESFAKAAGDPDAAKLAARMQSAAAETLPRFDTGYWTYYSLNGVPSPLSYQEFVVQLLRKLAPLDPRFASAAARIAAYQRQPPAFMVANAGLGSLRFWLSKPATVSVVTAAGPAKRVALGGGWHTLTWNEPKNAGTYPMAVTAVDWAGNHASFQALPVVRVTDKGTPSSAPAATTATPPTTGTPFAVGAGLSDPSQASLASSLGLELVRLPVPWTTGETVPDPGLLASLEQVPSSTALVLQLEPNPLPADDADDQALAQYATALAQSLPSLRDLILAPAPSAATAAAYAAAFTDVRAAVKAVAPGVAVGVAVDGSSAPAATVAALGQALAASGGTAPYADIVDFRPAPAAAAGAWTAADASQVVAALGQALGSAPPVLIDGLATPSTVPSTELGAYTGGAPPPDGAVAATAQGTTYAQQIGAASCTPGIAGALLDELVDDGAVAGPATGVYYAGGGAKASAASVKAEAPQAQRGIVVCPGQAPVVEPSTLTFPTALSTTAAVSLTLGCTRDCLYLVTLEGAGGAPLVASRGALRGGMPPVAVTLPKLKLAPGSYQLDVRLVSQVNPGAITQVESPVLGAS